MQTGTLAIARTAVRRPPLPAVPAPPAAPLGQQAAPAGAAQEDEPTDAELLAALQARDVHALELFYNRHSHLAYGLAYRLLGDRTAAEDVVQEAFLSVWRRAASFDARRGSVRAWLLSIIHHRAIDWLRSHAVRRGDVQLDLVERTLAAPDTWHVVLANVEREAIRRACACLPPEQQRTIELAYLAGYSQPEIAASMGVPLSTVKGRLRMALRKLRPLLESTDIWTGAPTRTATALTSCPPAP